MQMAVLGKSGLHVSRLCLGAMMLGRLGNRSHDECTAIVHRALDAGINFIDTADAYSLGESERIIGRALGSKRANVILATKFGQPMGEGPNRRGCSRHWIVQAVERSLKRLDTDYIDLYQVHRFDECTDLEEVLFTLTELVRQGKIRYFGSSMFSSDRIVESHWLAEKRALLRLRSEQARYSIFARDIERFVLPTCHRYGMGVMVWSPLDGGFLSGKYRAASDLAPDCRIARFEKAVRGRFDADGALHSRKLALVAELDALAAQANMTLPHLAVAFVLQHPYVTSAIIGPRTGEQLETLLPAADLKLGADVLEQIDRLVPPGTLVSAIADAPDGTRLRRAS
jgi:aryl-alcohol dehydrogenase-like predicted oxidoreductase